MTPAPTATDYPLGHRRWIVKAVDGRILMCAGIYGEHVERHGFDHGGPAKSRHYTYGPNVVGAAVGDVAPEWWGPTLKHVSIAELGTPGQFLVTGLDAMWADAFRRIVDGETAFGAYGFAPPVQSVNPWVEA